jgi:hypothetical protein
MQRSNRVRATLILHCSGRGIGSRAGGETALEHRHAARRQAKHAKEFLFLSDFDQTLSLQDSGDVLSEALGIPTFHGKVTDLAGKHFVKQGGELVQ